MNVRQLIVALLCLTCLSLFSPTLCPAADETAPGIATLDKLLKAIETNDYNSFVADGSNGFKAGLTKQMLQGVSNEYGPRFRKGYTRTYLGELKQQGVRVLLYKLTYKDQGDDTLVKLVLQNGTVDGFWLQ